MHGQAYTAALSFEKTTMSDPSSEPVKPTPPPSRILLERFVLGEKHFPSEAAYQAWKALPWWRRLFS